MRHILIFGLIKMEKKYLVYEGKCKKCTFIANFFTLFDLNQQFKIVPLRSKEARDLLHDFYEKIPYNFHYIDDQNDLCYTGLKAIPALFSTVIKGVLWPFNWNGSKYLQNMNNIYHKIIN